MVVKTLPVVPSSWEEGLGVVEKSNDITYFRSNMLIRSNLVYRYHPLPLLPEGGDNKAAPFSIFPHSRLALKDRVLWLLLPSHAYANFLKKGNFLAMSIKVRNFARFFA